jgi:hypothetical protein
MISAFYDNVSVHREIEGSQVEWKVFLTAGLLGLTSQVYKYVEGAQTDRWILESGETEFLTALLNTEQASEKDLLSMFPHNDASGLKYLVEEVNRVFGTDFVERFQGSDNQYFYRINPIATFDFAGFGPEERQVRRKPTSADELLEIARDLNFPGRFTLQ